MAALNVVFRADASVTAGSGHVMRCLTLADALTRRGAECRFICREEVGHLLELVRQRGHVPLALPAGDGACGECNWRLDVTQTRGALGGRECDWLVVDHYELGREWEGEIRSAVGRLLAIDDIGRSHVCDLLLDQNLGNPTHARYTQSRIGASDLLLGPEFALVGREFAELRPRALSRRDGSLRRLLLSMGGSDLGNETVKALAGISAGDASRWDLDIVIGASNPNRHSLEEACASLAKATLHVQTSKMAELMVLADCAVGAGGSTSWERCCLGLPALVTVMSSNQLPIAEALARAGAHSIMGWNLGLTASDYAIALEGLTTERLREMSEAAAAICDGRGAERVAERLQ
jgi:UDP-2,4-diacetamido-2,4,6-trideoxy-beta-L-altropyranose hydrolase